MTVGELKERLRSYPDHIKVIVEVDWEGTASDDLRTLELTNDGNSLFLSSEELE